MVNENTYWNGNGAHEKAAEALQAHVPAEGRATPDSPVELFRLASNAYYDLFNNGLGNAHLRLPELINAVTTVRDKGFLNGPEHRDFRKAMEALSAFLREHQLAESAWSEDRVPYPDDELMLAPMERILDTLVVFADQFADPNAAIPARTP